MASYKPEELFACDVKELYDVTPGGWLLVNDSWKYYKSLEDTPDFRLIHVKGNAWGLLNKNTGWMLKLAGEYKIKNAVEKYGSGPNKRNVAPVQETTEST